MNEEAEAEEQTTQIGMLLSLFHFNLISILWCYVIVIVSNKNTQSLWRRLLLRAIISNID